MEERDSQNQKSNGNLHPKVVSRAAVLLGFAVLLFSALLVRVFILQTVQHSHYQEKVLSQITTESPVNAKRGKILASDGKTLLAGTTNTFRVFISPSTIRATQSEYDETGVDVQLDTLIAQNLSELLDVSYEFALKQTTYTKVLDRTIKREVSEADADRVRAFIAQYKLEKMIYLESTYTRAYPYGSLASHALGFTGSDGTGLYGLEYYYDEYLAGTDGKYITARDAQGNEMPYGYKKYIEAQNGYNLVTTLDITVQTALEEQLERAYLESAGQNRAAGIVMDVNTGAILGMAVYPDFDLNSPRELDEQSLEKLRESGLDPTSEEYSALKQELQVGMWGNKAITESYIPGSTFKVVTAAMAIEEDLQILNYSYTCTGSYKPMGQTVRCHKTGGHGTLTFEEDIQQSCNPWLMRIGESLGKETFYSYLKGFGYLEKTGIDLPGEAEVLVKEGGGGWIAHENDFTGLDLAIYAFGQNFNVTLIRQITAISTVANGGYLVQPHLVSSIVDENNNVVFSYDTSARRQVVSEETCQRVAQILEEGVSGSGGAKNAYVAGYRVAAKTGTSEKKDAGNVGQYVCSTVAFAPADDPQYAVIIIVDEPTEGTLYGSTVAAPYVGNVLETILPYLGVDPKYSDAELKKEVFTVPDLVTSSYTVSYAQKQYPNVSFEVIGDGNIIYKQYPEAGTVVEKDSARMIVYTGSKLETEMTTVPNLDGMTALAANQVLANAGLNVRILGSSSHLQGEAPRVYMQSIEAGTSVPKGTVVEIRLREEDGLADYDDAWDPWEDVLMKP